MLQQDGYYELTLFNDHKLQVWSSAKFCILSHPLSCCEDDDSCRERIIKYIHHEGILDEVLDTPITMLDSYAKTNIDNDI